MEIIKIPRYSESDKKVRRRMLEEIEKLKYEYQARAEFYIKVLAEIESRAPCDYILPDIPINQVPKSILEDDINGKS